MHPCPICGVCTYGAANSRYPQSLCVNCAGQAVDEEGRPVQFFNTSISGGLMVRYSDNGSQHECAEFLCMVRGVKCRATEAHMGGIVLQPT